jgi:hypothetical protein
MDGARNQLDAVKMVFNEKIDRLEKRVMSFLPA